MTDLRSILEQAGFKGHALDVAYAIAMAESGGNAQAHNGNRSTGDNSYGLFQINMLGGMGPERLKRYGLSSNSDLFDPLTNAKVAYAMSNGGKNWGPWSTYNSGAYQKYLGQSGAQVNLGVGRRGMSAPIGGGSEVATGGSDLYNIPTVRLDQDELAQEYGYAAAILNSNPELKSLFQKALTDPKGQWTDRKFEAELRGTKWYQQHTESWRTAETLRLTDPATWTAKLQQAQTQVQQTAAQLGAQVSQSQLSKIANDFLHGGWSAQDLQKTLASYVTVQRNGSFGGQAGDMEAQLRQYAADNGVRVADSWISNGVKGVLTGTTDMNTLQNNLRTYALSAFPTLADQIKAGQSVKDIASPYIQSMGQLLEVDPATIDLFDPTIRSALSSTGQDGKPATKSLWQFENDLRNDPRWMQTNNARETVSGVANKILGDWGLISG